MNFLFLDHGETVLLLQMFRKEMPRLWCRHCMDNLVDFLRDRHNTCSTGKCIYMPDKYV